MMHRGAAKSGMSNKAWLRFLACLMVGVFLSVNLGIGDLFAYTYDGRSNIAASAFLDEDSDGDGLGDTWETNYFGSTGAYNGSDDPDGDGYSNLWEYRNGTDPTDPNDPDNFIGAKGDALQFLKDMMNKQRTTGKRILYSYISTGGATDSYGWTYDNAISAIAFAETGSWQRVKDILDAYIWFQDRDPQNDGRIRRAYWESLPIDDLHVGDCTLWIPTANAEAASQAVGDMSIMAIIALRYHEYLGVPNSDYYTFAKKLMDWIQANAYSTNGDGGYNMVRNSLELVGAADRKSTENNIDAYVAFMKLYEVSNNNAYRTYALHAKNFILDMWNTTDKMFWTGTLDNGITINGGVNSDVTGYDGVNDTSGQPEDPTTWGFLALGEATKYGTGVDWVENNCKVTNMDGYSFGYDFNADRDGIWFEGMGHMALSYQMLLNNTKSDSILDMVMQAQDNNWGGIECASHDGVTTSFGLWTLTDDMHVSPCAWFVLAVDNYNPFWGQAITDPIPYEGQYSSTGTSYIFNDPWISAETLGVAPAADGTARAMVDLYGTGGDDKGTLTITDDGVIVKYEWDFDGNGTYDWSSGNTGSVTYWYTEVGAHLAKFRVTSDSGYTSTRGVAVDISQADLGLGYAPPVVSGVSASSVSGKAPFAVTFTGSAGDSDGYITAYEWDFNGDGEYDSYSDTSGNVTYTYRESGTYQPIFRATDNDGLTDTASLAIEVTRNSSAPKAKAGADITKGKESITVSFNATGSSGDITSYEWDFEDDGSYDWVSVSDGNTTYTYGEVGTYEAKLRVTASNGTCATDTVKIMVEYDSILFDSEAVGSVDSSSGIVPFEVTFTHSASIGPIEKYEWDFEGDKEYDLSATETKDITHTYDRPGYYLATLKVTDSKGITDRTYIPIVATGENQTGSVYSSYIKTPKEGKKIYGNSVNVSMRITPNSNAQNLQLQYKMSGEGEGAWRDLNASISHPYRTAIDTTALINGDYDLRAAVNSIADKARKTTVTIDDVAWDTKEEVNANGERLRHEKVNKDEEKEIELFDGTKCTIKPGTLSADDTITIKVPNDSGTLIGGGALTIPYQRAFTLDSTTTLNKTVTISIPYEDADNDGIVDNLGIPESEIKLYYYNEVTAEWEPVADYTIYTDDNYVSGEVSHFSIYGLGGEKDDDPGVGVTSSGGGSLGSGGGGGGGGSRCFIATATFGTGMAREVQSLRDFRDTYLLTNRPGRFVVAMYERYSPPIADKIRDSKFFKGMLRFYLKPIVGFSRVANTLRLCSKGVDCHD